MRGLGASRASQRGVALLLVLWACTLLAILLGGYAALARTEGLQARYQFAHTRAHYAAEAGLMRALYQLHNPVAKQRWVGDGRIYRFRYDHVAIEVTAVNEGGKVDLNTAGPEVLQALFRAAGMDLQQAKLLAAHVVEWRSAPGPADERSAQQAAYLAAGRDYSPRHGPFASVEELQMVLGMTPAIYRAVAPVVTIWSGNASPDPNTAPPLALAAIPGMSPQRQRAILAARQVSDIDQSMALNNGTTHSIRSEATLTDGTRAVLRATIRVQAGALGTQPYTVLRWQEGSAE